MSVSVKNNSSQLSPQTGPQVAPQMPPKVTVGKIGSKKSFPANPIVNSTEFMVSTPHQLASEAAEKILKNGGNAVDAAVTAHLVLSVTTPEATGIGGGGFLNVYDNKQKKAIIYDARETAPAQITETEFVNKDGTIPSYTESVSGGRAVGVPGIVKGLKEMHENHGNLEWKDLFMPAIDAAENGFKMPKRLHSTLQKKTHYSRLSESSKRYYRSDGSLKAIGEIVKNPELANTLKQIAFKGIDSFYSGDIAKDIVDTATKTAIFPGKITLSDLENYKVIKRDPAEITYKNFKLYAPPAPSSGGIAVLQALKLLEPFNLAQYDANDLRAETLINNAIRLAYRDRDQVIGDPDFVKVDQEKLLSKDYLAPKQDSLSKTDKALEKEKTQPTPIELSDNTSHSSFMDQYGNGVSMTTSVEYALGSGLETKSGFILNSTMCDFTLDGFKTKSPNKIEPNKRPRSAMCPIIAKNSKNDHLRLIIGSPGGPAIIGFLTRRIIDILDHGILSNKASARPNYLPMSNDNTLEYEKDLMSEEEKAFLVKQNFKPVPADLWLSGFQIVEKDAGCLSGTADPRRDGVAIGG
ncbi:MAG: gamma-glutamyltranspeptidase/glutathione hydrolase [Alphaproteobacteria bacterium]|jgi:gamma-glutamyltranspeptidase/glutathione hydrolase